MRERLFGMLQLKMQNGERLTQARTVHAQNSAPHYACNVIRLHPRMFSQHRSEDTGPARSGSRADAASEVCLLTCPYAGSLKLLMWPIRMRPKVTMSFGRLPVRRLAPPARLAGVFLPASANISLSVALGVWYAVNVTAPDCAPLAHPFR